MCDQNGQKDATETDLHHAQDAQPQQPDLKRNELQSIENELPDNIERKRINLENSRILKEAGELMIQPNKVRPKADI